MFSRLRKPKEARQKPSHELFKMRSYKTCKMKCGKETSMGKAGCCEEYCVI